MNNTDAFIIFGRTIAFFISDTYNVDSGIIINSTETHYILNHKIKNTANEYEELSILKEKVYFDAIYASYILNIYLKEYIASKNNLKFSIDNLLSSYDYKKAYLFDSEKDIFLFEADSISDITITDSIGLSEFNLNPNINLDYRLIYKFNNSIYSSPIINGNIYNSELNDVELNFNDLELVNLPSDYNSYKIKLVNIPETINNSSIRFLLRYENSFESEIVAKTLLLNIIDEVEIQSDRFIEPNYSDDTLSYYKPGYKYGYYLFMEIDNGIEIKKYKFTTLVTDFTIEQNFDFNSFIEE